MKRQTSGVLALTLDEFADKYLKPAIRRLAKRHRARIRAAQRAAGRSTHEEAKAHTEAAKAEKWAL